MTTTLEHIRSRITFEDESADHLARLDGRRPVPGAFAMPAPDEARRTLARLGIADDAIAEIVRAMPSPGRDPEVWWVLERLYDELLNESDDGPLWWPWPAHTTDALRRYFQLYVLLAALPEARRRHAERGVSADVSWATFANLAMSVENYRRQHGVPGFNQAFWYAQHFRGTVFRLGRLQFNLWHVDFDPPAGAGLARGDPALGVHIPAEGPFTTEACDDAFDRARDFFPRHFPDRGPYRVATCSSWLLDTQLADYLPETSNIVRFQRRFELVRGPVVPGDADVLRYVFGYVPPSLDGLPDASTLERAVVRHLRSGRHWAIRTGWVRL